MSCALALSGSLLGGPGVASAQAREEGPAQREEPPAAASPASVPPPAAGAGPQDPPEPLERDADRRPVPNYDGRPETTSLSEAALWVPRVVLFPLYAVTEYLIRVPLGWFVSTAERGHWPTLIINFLTFNERQGGIVPTGLIDFGLRPSVGLYAFWNDFFVADNDLRFRAAYGGSGFYLVRLTDRFPLGSGSQALNLSYESRPDNVFHGIGRVHDASRSRYFRAIARAEAMYSVPWYRSSRARFAAGVRQVQLDGDRRCCDDAALRDRVRAGAFPLPAGMDQVYEVADQSVEVVLDSRWPRNPELPPASDYVPPPGHGVRLALRAGVSELLGQTLAPAAPLADGWVHYGASLGGFVDLTGYQRSLGLRAVVDFVDPIGAGPVPLTDLVSLGGDRLMRGFLPGELVDRSAAVLRLEYHWPVAVWLDGSLMYEVGNVFGAHLSGLGLGQLRSSYGLGLQTIGDEDHVFQLLLAIGSESFDAGGRLDSFRFVFGTSAGF